MKYLALSSLFLLACGTSSTLESPPIQSATQEENAAVSTRIRVHYSANMRPIEIRGAAPLSWSTNATPSYTAKNTFTLDFLAPKGKAIEWKPLLSGEWARGENYVVKGGETVDVYPRFFNDWGRVIELASAPRKVWAYLPPSYDENTAAMYPVLYMNDGHDLFEDGWDVPGSLDRGVQDGWLKEIVVIMIDNTPDRGWEYTPTRDEEEGFGGGGEEYLSYVIDDLMPLVRSSLRVSTSRHDTGMMGSSLGGLISAWAGLHHGDVFGVVGALSPSSFWDNELIVREAAQAPPWPLRADRVYVDSGNAGELDDDVTQTTRLANAYLKAGYKRGFDFLHVVQDGGEHSQYYWAQRFPGAVEFLFR